MSSSRELAKDVKKIAEALGKAAVWNRSKKSVDMLKDDYLFELLCFFTLVKRVKSKFGLKLAGNVATVGGKRSALWPKKPGLKKNFSFFLLRDSVTKTEVFQLCPGIKILDKNNKCRAPDVNLLSGGAPDNLTYAHLVACWDAKHTQNDKSRLPDVAVSDFVYTYQQLGSPTPKQSWTTKVSAPTFLRSGLITNGRFSTETVAALKAEGILETAGFPNALETRP